MSMLVHSKSIGREEQALAVAALLAQQTPCPECGTVKAEVHSVLECSCPKCMSLYDPMGDNIGGQW